MPQGLLQGLLLVIVSTGQESITMQNVQGSLFHSIANIVLYVVKHGPVEDSGKFATDFSKTTITNFTGLSLRPDSRSSVVL